MKPPVEKTETLTYSVPSHTTDENGNIVPISYGSVNPPVESCYIGSPISTKIMLNKGDK